MSSAPLRATHSVLLADEVHRQVTRNLDGGREDLLGHAGAATHHQHAHWIPIANNADRGATTDALVVWVPTGLTPDEVTAILKVRKASGQRGRDNGYHIKGLPDLDLLLQAVGTIEQVAPELSQPARVWRSLTPYLPVRHRQRAALDDHLATDVRKELHYRGLSEDVVVNRLNPSPTAPDRWAIEFRRYRATETIGQARYGVGLQLTFPEETAGPLLLGRLSHFGYGIFLPEDRANG